MKRRNTLFFQDDLTTFLASPWLLKSSVIIQFGGKDFCWSEEGWCRCQMSINLQSIIVTTWRWSRPGDNSVTKAVNGRTKLSTKAFRVLHMQKHCIFSSCTNSPLSLVLTFFLPYLCPCYCPLPWKWAFCIFYFPESSGSTQPRASDNSQRSHRFSPENCHKLLSVLPFRTLWPLLAIQHWFFFSCLACFPTA